MSLSAAVTDIMKLMEDRPLFRPAPFDAQAMRLYPDDPVARQKHEDLLSKAKDKDDIDRLRRVQKEEQHAEELQRRREFLASIPYTYNQITTLPAYQKIVSLPGVKDVTTFRVSRNRTVAFRVDVGPYSNEYKVHANGYLRTMTNSRAPGILRAGKRVNKFPAATTLEGYEALLERIYKTIVKFIEFIHRHHPEVVSEK